MQFPKGFIDNICNAPGFDETAFSLVHQEQKHWISVRTNAFKTGFNTEGLQQIPWCEEGYYLPERPVFTNDPLFHAGAYYVQEASSMFISHILKKCANLDEPLRVLDLCAAPGGKSTLIASLLNADSILLSNEVIKTRAGILSDNITRWGLHNVFVSNNDPKQIASLTGYFDIIVVDAPCSGSGLFRKDPQAMKEWSEDNVKLCHQRQQRILADIMPALKEGGLLVYSTCSYSVEENENIADWLIDEFEMENISVPIEEDWGIIESKSATHKAKGYRFYPDKLKGEGFFAACFKKTREENEVRFKPKTVLNRANKNEVAIIFPWLQPDPEFMVFKHHDEYYLIEQEHEYDLLLFLNYLYLRKSATRLGKIMGKDFIPDHELALSTALSAAVPRVEVDKETALLFLKKQNIRLPDAAGWNLISYAGCGLGWVKVLPNRVNNYLPKELRILRDIEE